MKDGCAMRGLASLLFWAAAFCGLVQGSESAPQWLRQAASANVPTYDQEVAAIVLFKERTVAVEGDGRQRTESRGAIKILRQAGHGLAMTATPYGTDWAKIRDMNAWLILPSGQVREYGRTETVDMAAVSEDLYNEVRLKFISATREAEPGSVFGYQTLSEETPLFHQLEWQFQERMPVLRSTITLQLPPGWHARSTTFNHTPIEPVLSGSRYRWELLNLPYIKNEPASPHLDRLAPRLGVSYFPPSGSDRTHGRSFHSWEEVSSWLADLNDPRAAPSDAISIKTRELTSGAKNESEKIRAIARYVQAIRYVSIQSGIGRGGGYLPHPAAEAFTKSYGDCKDKAALMRAMLKAAGIRSHAVALYAGDPGYVTQEWPTPQQFDHIIVAISAAEDSFSAMIFEHPQFGRLLFFDPTDPDTVCGDLPADEQGGLALLVAPRGGGLVRMSSSSPDANRMHRQIETILDGQGAIKVRMREQASGQAGASYRRAYRSHPGSKYRELLESWIAGDVTGAHVLKLESADRGSDGAFEVDIEFAAERYGQLMQQRLLVFRPAIVSQRRDLSFAEPVRTHPVVLEPYAFAEGNRFTIPQGFAVDECPEPVGLETSFGSYSATVDVQRGGLLFTRKLVLSRSVVPADQYPALRKFFEDVRAAERAAVVLVKK